MTKMIFLLYILITGLIQTTVPLEEVSKYTDKIIKVNCLRYHTIDNGRTITFKLDSKHPAKSLVISLTGTARKKILTAMQARRDLNRQVESPLDTSLTATGKIILINGRLTMIVRRPADISLGADLQIERP
ncbi:hypothetical protein [Mucilaginibacter sp. HD30]